MSSNPLKPAILSLLKMKREGVSEYQLIRHLELEQTLFSVTEERSELALFQKHFIVMNALYQLQQSLLEDDIYLAISPLSIQLQNSNNRCETALSGSADRKLRDYYLDLSQLEETTASDVSELLNSFWARYRAIDKRAEALIKLGLDEDAEWAGVQKRYRQLAAQHHPDRGGEQAAFIAIREAYEVLSCCFKK